MDTIFSSNKNMNLPNPSSEEVWDTKLIFKMSRAGLNFRVLILLEWLPNQG